MTLADQFFAFDDALKSKAHQPPLSSWWRSEARRFLDAYESGSALEHWACTGRGGSKSTYSYKLALFLALSGKFHVPSNEMHFAMVLSKNKIEAQKAIAIIARWLTALGVEHDPKGEVIELPSFRRGIRVVSASVSATSGWRCFAVFADEFSKWSRESEAQLFDADETLASARATTVTHERAPLVVTSTPWTTEGSFYEAIVAGDVDDRVVSGPVPSWFANPDAITEAHTRRVEKREHVWRREYACEFVDAIQGGYFTPEMIAKCTDLGRDPRKLNPVASRRYVIAIDPAFQIDRFAVIACHAENRDGHGVVVVDYVAILTGDETRPEIAVSLCAQLRSSLPGGRAIYSDQFSQAALSTLFLQRGVVLLPEAWTGPLKVERYGHTRAALADGRIRLPDDPALRAELGRIGIRLTQAGNELIHSTGPDDRVSALVHCAWHAARLAPMTMVSGMRSQATRTLGKWETDALFSSSPQPEYTTIEREIGKSVANDGKR